MYYDWPSKIQDIPLRRFSFLITCDPKLILALVSFPWAFMVEVEQKGCTEIYNRITWDLKLFIGNLQSG